MMTIICKCDEGGPCQIHPDGKGAGQFYRPPQPLLVPKTVTEEAVASLEKLEIETADKLQVKQLQCAALEANSAARDANERVQFSIQSLNQFVRVLMEKNELDPKKYTLDLQTLKFVRLPEIPAPTQQ